MKIADFTITIPKRGYIAVGLLLRLFLAPFLSHPFDMRVFMAVGAAVARGITPYGQYLLQDSFASSPHEHLYGTVPGIGYPPPWGLISGGSYLFSSIIAPNNIYVYILALKIPIILGELALAVLIYNILKAQVNERIATATFLLFIFCPFVVSIGTIWGMFDVIALIFALLAAYSLQRDWAISAILLSISSVFKVFPIVLAPLFAILIYKFTKSKRNSILFIVFTASLSFMFTFAPMHLFNWPTDNLYNALTYHVTTANPSYDNMASYPYGAASPFNAFSLLSNLSGGGIQPPSFLVYLWIPACIAVCIALFRAPMVFTSKVSGASANFVSTIQWSLLLLLTFFSTRAWVSEQNLIFLFVFFSLSVFLQNPQEWDKIELMWLLLFIFVLIHVPVVSFFWYPLPWTLNAATAFADGPLAWTRLLLMTALTFSWLAVSWHYAIKKLRWRL